MEALGEIEIASRLIETSSNALSLNPIDQQYATLRTDIQALDPKSKDVKMIKDYVPFHFFVVF